MAITNLSQLTLNTGPVLPSTGGPIYTGRWFFVNASTGSDGNTGAADQPLATLQAAQLKCTANSNDVVAFIGTFSLTASLTWDKNGVHLIGMCAPTKRGKAARIISSGTTAFAPLINITATGCNFMNFATFYGFNSASNNTIAVQDTGGNNSYDNVEFLGFGDGTASTGTANITGARAHKYTGSTGQNTYRYCVFGTDSVQRNATNYTIEISGAAPRMTFQECDFEAYLASSGTAACHVLIGAAGIDRYCNFVQCHFMNDTKSTGSAMAQCFNLSGTAGGFVMLDQCQASLGITKWETSASGNLILNMSAPSTTAGGYSVNNS